MWMRTVTKKNKLYLVVEGPGGVGKDFRLKHLRDKFTQLGYRVVLTREPGGTPRAEKIREELFRLKAANQISVEQEIAMAYAARVENMTGIVMPEMMAETNEKVLVLKGRDFMSTFMFQGASGADDDMLMWYHKQYYQEMGFVDPDWRILLTADKGVCIARRRVEGFGGDGFDMQPNSYLERVWMNYGAAMLDIMRGNGLFAGTTEVFDNSIAYDMGGRERLWAFVENRLGLDVGEGHLDFKPAFSYRSGERRR